MTRLALPAAVQRWLFRVSGPEAAPILLGQRRIFVLPTRFGLALALTLLVMLLVSINYALSLGFALTFLVGGVAWMSIHHAFRNLVGLCVSPGRGDPVFAGAPARFGVILHNASARPRIGLILRPSRQAGGEHADFDVPANASTAQDVLVPSHGRGWLAAPRLTLETRHPLGLIRAWSLFQPDHRCLIYPAPEAGGPPLPIGADDRPGNDGGRSGQSDFAGLRHHQPADSPRHVAWKAVARGGPWQTKEFAGGGADTLALDWARLPPGLGTEARLSRLARWVIDADASGLRYSLTLPGARLPAASGPAHRHACLAALALFGAADG